MVKNWKSTLSGAITSGAALILAMNAGGVILPKWVVITAGFVMSGGFLSMGIVGKDYDVSGK